MAVEATHVFKENQLECYDDETQELVREGINPISFPGLKLAVTSDESISINFDEKPKVIISASGMCDAGRIRHHLKHNLWRKECTVVFAGYQAEGTLGRSLVDGSRKVKLFGETIDVEARIVQLHDISGHADRDGLLKWADSFEQKPSQYFIVHGQDDVCDRFAQAVTERTGCAASAPYSGSEYDLAAGCWIRETAGIPVEKKSAARKAQGVFARLVAAGERLLSVISHNEGGTNKDLAKFADQINALCDKWDR
jgi:metallo-beta-lactamase family protein